MISNTVKRNISATLLVVGLFCIIGSIWDVVMEPKSGKAWFDLGGIVLLTYLCFDNFMTYRRRVKDGIKFGSN